jgi:hypothetical protein
LAVSGNANNVKDLVSFNGNGSRLAVRRKTRLGYVGVCLNGSGANLTLRRKAHNCRNSRRRYRSQTDLTICGNPKNIKNLVSLNSN